jgi:actin-related protein 5
LDEDQIREKKKQRLLKAGYEARLRARAEKVKEREERAAELKREEEERNRDPVKWVDNLRQSHQVCVVGSLIRNGSCLIFWSGTEPETP